VDLSSLSKIGEISRPSGEFGDIGKGVISARYSRDPVFSSIQCRNFLAVLLLSNLVTEIEDLAVDLDLSLVATDGADDLLRICPSIWGPDTTSWDCGSSDECARAVAGSGGYAP
jgi:hypothetical protein